MVDWALKINYLSIQTKPACLFVYLSVYMFDYTYYIRSCIIHSLWSVQSLQVYMLSLCLCRVLVFVHNASFCFISTLFLLLKKRIMYQYNYCDRENIQLVMSSFNFVCLWSSDIMYCWIYLYMKEWVGKNIVSSGCMLFE